MVALDKFSVFRIISMALAGGDVFQTVPGTVAMYRKQWKRRRLSAVCLFYAIARYMSIASLIANGFGAFYTGYTPESCKKVYMLPNVTALIAGMAVQVLVYIRTHAISGRSKYVFYGLGGLMVLGFPVQIFGIVYHRDPSFNNGTCKGKVLHPEEPDWNIVYYTAHMVFDLVAFATATFLLVASSRVLGVVHFSQLIRRVLRDGLLYFLVVFLVNLWVVLEFADVFQSGAASSLPLAVVLIAIQHLTLSTQRLSSDRPTTENYSQSVSVGPPRFFSGGDSRHSRGHSRQLDVELQSGLKLVGSGASVEPFYKSTQPTDKSSTSQSSTGVTDVP